MADDQLRVDPVVLDLSAQRMRDLRDGIRSCEEDAAPETTAAAYGLHGWYTARGLEELLWRWRDDIDRFARLTDRLADALAQTAHDYRASDAASADRFRWRG